LTTADTLEITTSTDYINNMVKDKFITSTVLTSKGMSAVNYILDHKIDGLQRLSVGKTNGVVKIKVSSKILGLDYPKGISLNTIENVCSKINKTGIILDTDFINDSITNLVDVKDDLPLTVGYDKYINSLSLLNNPKFAKTKYTTGITFNENIKSTPLRFTCYGKYDEVLSNKKFYYKYPSLVNYFKGLFRLESRFKNRKTIKKHFNDCDLVSVLTSKDVNLNSLIKVIDNQTNIVPFLNTDGMTNKEEQNFAQILYLNNLYDGDFNAIMNHIKSKLGPNTKATYQRNKVKKYLAMISNAEEIDTISNLKDLENALKEVY
jgi:hypothetical protein